MRKLKLDTDFRYERKYLWPHAEPSSLVQQIKFHPALFTELYPMRTVYSLYFDTPNLFFLQQNVLGHFDRAKVRLRWYEQDGVFTKPHLEIKYKQGDVNTKYFFDFPIEDQIMNSIADYKKMTKITSQVQLILVHELQQASLLQPCLLNYYQRQYYFSKRTQMRVTVDSELKCKQHSDHLYQLSFRTQDNCILELKYEVEDDKKLRAVTNQLPLRISKVSKYEIGMRMTYPQAS